MEKEKRVELDPDGAGNVEQAATKAAKSLYRVTWFVTWETVMGIAGRNGQSDALATTLY